MDPQTNAAPEGRKRRGGLTGLLIALVVVLLLAAAAYLFMGSDRLANRLSDGSVLASVNGVEITEQHVNDRIAHARTGLEAQGLNLEDPATHDLLRSQALEELINETVVLADAEAKGIAATEAEVEEQYSQIRARFETEAAFQEELANNSFTTESLRENIRRELTIQKYVSGIADDAALTVTDEEIEAFYGQLSAQTEGLPPLAELRPEIETQLRNQKLAAAVQQIVEQLKAEADITVSEEAAPETPETVPAQ